LAAAEDFWDIATGLVFATNSNLYGTLQQEVTALICSILLITLFKYLTRHVPNQILSVAIIAINGPIIYMAA